MNSRSQPKSDLLYLALITGAALATGLYLIVTCVLITPDGVFYIRQAQALARDPWVIAGKFPPGYPLLLLGAHKLATLFAPGGSALGWVYSAQAVTLLCRVLALACLYFAGKLLTDARRSFWAVLILAFLPYPTAYGSVVLREWPFLLLLALGLWLLLWSLRAERWWGFGLVGLAAGLGFLIRPESAQLLVYGAVGLVVVSICRRRMRRDRASAAAALAVCFLVPAAPYLLARGTLVPAQLRPPTSNGPPVISSVADRSAGDRPLDFSVASGATLELDVAVSDPDGDAVALSVVTVPPGARPVYRFRGPASGDCFLTVSEDEKSALAVTYSAQVLAYDGIAFYAWTEPNEPAGPDPVHRFWSSAHSRHLYTISESERDALLEGRKAGQWQSEGVAFYAFAAGRQPADAQPVYRHQSGSLAPHWTLDGSGTVAWYAWAGRDAPAGLTVDATAMRWRPGPDQRGEHWLNLIADDGRLQSCQLIRITVRPGAARQAERVARATLMPGAQNPGPRRVWEALYEFGGAFAADMMYFLVVPLGLGLYRFLKDEAGPSERALTAAVIVVNVGLILARYVWVDPGPTRRYCLALVALAMFHIPAGAEIMARWIRASVDLLSGRRAPAWLSQRFWFCFLVALALGPMCLPKLLGPLGAEKRSYRQVARWLRDHTSAEAVIAVPDGRISFYAERQGLPYDEHPDSRRADYIVTLVGAGNSADSVPDDWHEVYSVRADKPGRFMLVVYRTR